MKVDPEKMPALHRVLNNQFARPDGCSDCPFAFNPQDVNYADPDEGHYDCKLLQKEAIWGEEPECEGDDWRERARDELTVL